MIKTRFELQQYMKESTLPDKVYVLKEEDCVTLANYDLFEMGFTSFVLSFKSEIKATKFRDYYLWNCHIEEVKTSNLKETAKQLGSYGIAIEDGLLNGPSFFFVK